MTTHRGWNDNMGHEPENQRPSPIYPWEVTDSQSNNQPTNLPPGKNDPYRSGQGDGAGMASTVPYQLPDETRSNGSQPWTPASDGHLRDGKSPDFSYPARSPDSADQLVPGTQIPTAPPVSDGADFDDDLEMSVTARMARLSRNPEYLQTERVLANRRRARARLSELMLLVDVVLSLLLIFAVQHFSAPISRFVPQIAFLKTSDAIIFGIVVLCVWPIVFSLLGLYRSSWVNNIFAPMRAILTVGIAGLAVSGILYFLVLDRMRIFWLTFVVLDALLLALARIVLRPLSRLSAPRRRILIVGTGRLAIDAARAVSARSSIGLQIVGVVGPQREYHHEPDAPGDWQEALFRRWASWRLGSLRDAPHVVREKQVDLVLVALSPRERYEASWLISSLANLPVQIYVLPDVVTETAKTEADEIDGIPVIGLTESAISGWNARIKRMMDLAICVPMLVVLSPVLLIIALLVRLDSPGPALFRQERIGQHNRRFTMLKFRTMRLDTEKRMKEMAERIPTSELVHKRPDNPNITRLGAILRRTSLDELPQLFNIIKGDMSVVGPRPELPWIVERYRAWQYRRLLVPQGLTGWWQVNGRSNRILHLHTQDDIFYVRNYSLLLDLKILLMTIKIVLTGHGAF
jgi:exopolysaccharide biosynthesis polyprenyl glycosylphosphotransferase